MRRAESVLQITKNRKLLIKSENFLASDEILKRERVINFNDSLPLFSNIRYFESLLGGQGMAAKKAA